MDYQPSFESRSRLYKNYNPIVFNNMTPRASCNSKSGQYTQSRRATMPSEVKSEPSSVHGAESHGPTTPQDRATSPVSPSSHGITARTLILQNEIQDHF